MNSHFPGVALGFAAMLAVGGGSISGCVSQLEEWGKVDVNGQRTPIIADSSADATASTQSLDTDTAAGDISPHSAPTRCSNGQLDDGETGIDCGGTSCLPCAVAWSCRVDRDCESQVCDGICLALACGNGIADDVETDLDCGGPCAPCDDGAGCASGADCESGICNGVNCVTPDCDDAVLNGNESDIDCGGSDCYSCDTGSSCNVDDDCSSSICAQEVCVEQGCADGARGGGETDVDCGGPDCTPCAGDLLCSISTDCESGVCIAISGGTRRCSDSSCGDGVHNGREADVDCGGADCVPCADLARCRTRIDCASSVCDRGAGSCLPAACDDDVRNGRETDVDCGANCPRCEDAGACLSDADCMSSLCLDGQCRAATCSDSRQNGSESDVDCGGACQGCELGKACTLPRDCSSGDCDRVCKPGVAGRPCDADDECASNACIGGACAQFAAGVVCEAALDCRSGHCSTHNTCGKGALGTQCTVNDDCASAICEANACAPSRFGIATDGGTDTSVVTFKARVQANVADPPRHWRDVALLYFFTPEAHDDFVSRYYDGPDLSVWDARFLAVSEDGLVWAMIWRAAATNISVIPTTTTTLDYQLRNDPWMTFDLSNDHSFRAGGFGVNETIVVCQRVDGRWMHTQGAPPASFRAPCDRVVDACPAGATDCDSLQRTQ